MRALGAFAAAALGIVLSFSDLSANIGQGQRGGGSESRGGLGGSTQIVSPVAVATYFASPRSEPVRTVQLTVVWRGQPGWFLKGDDQSSARAAGGAGGAVVSSVSFGSVGLRVEFDPKTRAASVQGTRIELQDNNVVLVDGVDSSAGSKIVKVLRVTPQTLESTERIEHLLRRSSEIVSFLNCDISLGRPGPQALIEKSCSIVREK